MKLFGRKTKPVDDQVQLDKTTDQPTAPVADLVKPVITKKTAEVKPEAEEVESEAIKTNRAPHILLRPVVSEKATLVNALNKYVFEVAAKANKIEIKKAINEVYGVTPKRVSIINQRGKFVRYGRQTGFTKDTKKAIITLKKGDSIKIYEGI